ncbi:hypothetical protein ON010_g3273 [Phytophthora cinnamomi]|nr:hypothetical protein ON010_g3273 [Phytophthora cinnamomi]
MKTHSVTKQVKENLSSSAPSQMLSTSKRGSARPTSKSGSAPPTTEPILASNTSSTTEFSTTSNATEPSLASSAIMAPVSVESVSPCTPASSSLSSAPSTCSDDMFPSATILVPYPSPKSASAPSTWAAAQNGSEPREVIIQDVRDACVSSKTQRAYRGSLAVISRWIRSSKGDEPPMYFTSTIQLNLTDFTPSAFEAFLLKKRKSVTVGDDKWVAQRNKGSLSASRNTSSYSLREGMAIFMTRGYPPLKRVGTHDLPREQMQKTC